MSELGDNLGELKAEEMVVTKFDQARGAFQGHKLITLEGNWKATSRPISGYFVPTAQPLGLLVFDLLQPDTVDGLTSWGVFGESFPVESTHPVLRVSTPVKLKLKKID
jgi:hypothetical protein